MLELYHHGTSVCAAKPRIVLAEKRLAWTGRYIDTMKGDQFSPEYRKLNPKHVVPTLVHDGNVIRESTVICEYLDDVFPEVPLKPASAIGRAAMRMWTKRIDEEIHPVTSAITFPFSHRHAILANGPAVAERFINEAVPEQREERRQMLARGIEDPVTQAALRIFDRLLSDMELQLERTTWLAGEEFTLAETAVISYVNRLDMLQFSGLWIEARPRVTDWFARVKKRPSFEPALMKFVPSDLRELMRENGGKVWAEVREIIRQAR